MTEEADLEEKEVDSEATEEAKEEATEVKEEGASLLNRHPPWQALTT